ncbi:hypothetical protein [Schumannella luteola]
MIEISVRQNVGPRLLLTLGLFSLVLSGCTGPVEPDSDAHSPTAEVPNNEESAEPYSLTVAADEAWARVTARFPDATRPDVQFERHVTQDEWNEVRIQCLGEQGFIAEATEGGGLGGTIPDGQAEAFAIARYVCDVRFPMDPRFTTDLTETQLEHLYEYFADSLTGCLESEGFNIASPPSLEVFVSTYYSPESWSPYNEVIRNLGDRSFAELEARCPQLPEDLYAP